MNMQRSKLRVFYMNFLIIIIGTRIYGAWSCEYRNYDYSTSTTQKDDVIVM